MQRYQDLTRFIPLLEKTKVYGEWVGEEIPQDKLKKDECGRVLPYVTPYVRYAPEVSEFMNVVSHYQAGFARDALKENAIEYTEQSLLSEDAATLSPELAVSFIRKVVSNERYRDGAVLEYLENGRVLAWLKRLQEIDG